MKPVEKLIVFRAPQYDADLPNQWRFAVAGQLDFSWAIVNPSGEAYIDAAYEGMGEQRAITPEQAQGDKRQTLINCAIYTARQILPKYGETATDATEVEIR
jgi:hypothetical protein